MQKRSFGIITAFWPIPLILSIFSAFTLANASCNSSNSKPGKTDSIPVIPEKWSDSLIPYDLQHPSSRFVFPEPELEEISALRPTSTRGIYCAIADEKGEIFLLDLAKNGAITQRILFKDKGDFEGIEMVGDTIFALQSNAKLYQITHWQNNAKPVVEIYENPLNDSRDLEGLCYDRARHSLLMACKEDPELSVKRSVYAFDLSTKKMLETPVYQIDPNEVDQKVVVLAEDKERHFSTSGIAIHPKTNDIYMISTSLKRMAVLDYKTGQLKAAVRLDREVFRQPEGIAFDADGNLYISSEGKKKEGYVVVFHPK